MSEATQGAPEAITKDDFLAFRDQVAQFAQAQAREIEALKQQRVAAKPDPQQVAQQNLPPDVDEKLREEIIGNPRRYTAEVVAIAKKQAKDEIMAEVTQREQASQNTAYWNQFWGGFFNAHPELSELRGEVQYGFSTLWNQQPTDDHFKLAEHVANEVRDRATRVAQAQTQAAERQKRNARQAAGAPGSMALPPMARDAAVQEDGPERLTAKEALVEAMSEFEQHRAKKMWDHIDTPEYRASAQARAARVVIKKSA